VRSHRGLAFLIFTILSCNHESKWRVNFYYYPYSTELSLIFRTNVLSLSLFNSIPLELLESLSGTLGAIATY